MLGPLRRLFLRLCQTLPDGRLFLSGHFLCRELLEGCRDRVGVPALEEHQIPGMICDLVLLQSKVDVVLLRHTGERPDVLVRDLNVGKTGVLPAIVIILTFTAGSSVVMWMGEQITEHGIGNGVSVILLANIVSGLPAMISSFWANLVSGKISGIIIAIVSVIIGLGMVVFVVFMNESERRLPIQYAKKVVGRKMYGGQSTNLPLKVNMTGVMPIIFANSIVTIPATIALFFPTPKEGSFWAGFFDFFGTDSIVYAILTFVLIIAFAYFYISISFNPVEVSNNLRNNGGAIPGIRPGKPTVDYIKKILNRITLLGAIFLCGLSGIPMIVNAIWYAIDGVGISDLAFSGTSLLIVVGVALETFRELEAQMTLRNYKGFLD